MSASTDPAGPPGRAGAGSSRWLYGLLALSGPLMLLVAAAPVPAPLRATAAVAAVTAGWGLAFLPWWWGGGPGATARRLAAPIILGTLPWVFLTALGLMGLRLGPLVWITRLTMTGAAVSGLVLWIRRSTGSSAPPAVSRPGMIALAVMIAVVAVLAARFGAPLGPMDDAFDHLASIRHIVEAGRVDFPGAFYPGFHPGGQDPRKGGLHVALAVAESLARVDPITLWRWAPLVLAPLMACAYASLGYALFGGAALAAAAVLSLMLTGADPLWLLRGAYGGHWGLAVAWAAIAWALSAGGFRRGLAAGAAAAVVHAYSPAQMLAPLVVLLALDHLRPGRRGNGVAPAKAKSRPDVAAFVLGALVGAVPLEIARLVLAAPVTNPLHGQSMGWLLLPPGPIASPLDLLRWYGYVGAAAAVALLLTAPWRHRTGRFLLASGLAPALLLFNPWLFGTVARHLGSVANKVALDWCYPMVAVWVGVTLARESGRRRLAAGIGAVILVLPLLFQMAVRVPALGLTGDDLSAYVDPAVQLTRRVVPPGEAVASDPMTSYALPALTGRPVVVTLHQHSPPGDGDALGRLAAAADLFSACVPLEEAVRAVTARGARWVLDPGPPPFRIDQFGNHLDPRNAATLESRFSSRPDLLAPAGMEGPARLYRIRAVDGPPGEAQTPGGLEGPGSGAPAPNTVMVTDGTVSLGVEWRDQGPVRRGEQVSLSAFWRREGDTPDYIEYFGHLRFEAVAAPAVPGILRWASKPLRRIILEPAVGGSFRWRRVEMPFRGLCPVAAWPAGEWLDDSLTIQVPANLVPGIYRLSLALKRGSLYPRLTSADLFSDRDAYSGPTLGTLEIR